MSCPFCADASLATRAGRRVMLMWSTLTSTSLRVPQSFAQPLNQASNPPMTCVHCTIERLPPS